MSIGSLVSGLGLRSVLGLALIVSGVASAQPAASPPAPSSPGAADFAQLPFIESARMSPDGTHIAGILGVGGVRQIGIYSLFNKDEPPLRFGVPESTEADSVAWVNDNNVLLWLRALVPIEGDNWYVTRLAAINRKTHAISA